jgi:hypothetical protein
MGIRARRRIGTRHGIKSYSLAGKYLGYRLGLRAIRGHDCKLGIRQPVTDFDGHCILMLSNFIGGL